MTCLTGKNKEKIYIKVDQENLVFDLWLETKSSRCLRKQMKDATPNFWDQKLQGKSVFYTFNGKLLL